MIKVYFINRWFSIECLGNSGQGNKIEIKVMGSPEWIVKGQWTIYKACSVMWFRLNDKEKLKDGDINNRWRTDQM